MRLVFLVAAATLLCGAPLVCDEAGAGVREVAVGGRLMWDYLAWGDVESDLGLVADDGTEVRRARLCASGKVYERLKFKVEWDFADCDEVCLKDGYLELIDVPPGGSIRVGHMHEPFCMNELTSSKYITFMERASLTAFAPSRNSGLTYVGNAGGRSRWELGVFATTDESGSASGALGASLSGRISFIAAGEAESDRLLHVGGAVNYLAPEGDEIRFSARPEVHMSGRLVDTGELMARDVLRLGAEVGAVFGPAHFAGEYVAAIVSGPDDSLSASVEGSEYEAALSGYYVQAGYFLTGESRTYKAGKWGRVAPRGDFLADGGSGAVELAVRYSSLDLNDGDSGIVGGALQDVTVGLNWYLHANARLMLNQVWATARDAEDGKIGSATATMMRLQFDF
ncbi:MAG: hypothetical protein GF400_04455 [Candidatus Eisenbacteria bacterium]|nr:hypothetical protein [Candidatus Eisenbacteria bacterium]